MKNQKKKSFPRRVFLCLLAILLAVCIAFDIYVSDYYHTDPAAEDAMVSDRFVSVTEQNGNWVFAPESPTAGLIFYPGGKVENTTYAPLLHDLAEDGILCVLVKMPCSGRTGHERGGQHPGTLFRSHRLVHRRTLAGRGHGGKLCGQAHR